MAPAAGQSPRHIGLAAQGQRLDPLRPSQAERQGPLRARRRVVEIGGAQRELRAALEVGGGAGRVAALLQVARQHQGITLPALRKPGGRGQVSGGPIPLGERGVGSLAQQRVAERELELAGEAALRPPHQELSGDEPLHPVVGRLRGAAEQLRDPAGPEGVAEHAGRAQHPARSRVEPVEPRLHRGQHRRRERDGRPGGALAGGGHGADQLLEEERVAFGERDHPVDDGAVRVGAEREPRQPLRGLARERLEAQPLDAAAGPQAEEAIVQLGEGEAEDHPRRLLQAGEGRVQEAERGGVAPLQIVEEEEHRARRAGGAEEVDEGAAHLLAGEPRIAAHGPELGALLRGKGHARDLAEELGDALDVALRRARGHALGEPPALLRGGLALVDAAGGADHLPEQAQGRGLVRGGAAGHPHLQVGAGAPERRHRLGGQA